MAFNLDIITSLYRIVVGQQMVLDDEKRGESLLTHERIYIGHNY